MARPIIITIITTATKTTTAATITEKGEEKKWSGKKKQPYHINISHTKIQRVGHQHTKPIQPEWLWLCVCDIRTEITINLQPFLILNWTAELGDRRLKRRASSVIESYTHAVSLTLSFFIFLTVILILMS